MRTADVTVNNQSGLHARPAGVFTREAFKWTSTVQLENITLGKGPVDAKRLIPVISMEVDRGHRIRLTVEGPDEEAALAALLAAIDSGLGEGA